jgi:flagellar basal body-associated protein FliL
MPDLIRSLLEQASAQGSRSTALNPLGWALAIALSGLAAIVRAEKAPGWLIVLLSVLVSILVLAYLVAYFYFMRKDPDALRSEKFTLSKMAIEKSITGDSLKGFTKLMTGESTSKVLSIAPVESERADG